MNVRNLELSLVLLALYGALGYMHIVIAQPTPNQQKLVVEATGIATGGENSTPRQVEQAALADAQQKALSQAGIYIESYTEVKMAMMSKERVSAWSQGFVKVLEELNSDIEFLKELRVFKATKHIKAEVQLANIKDFIRSVEQEDNANNQKELTFEFSFVTEKELKDGSVAEVKIKEGMVLYSGDQYVIVFRSSNDCYLYIINVDADKNLGILFPNSEVTATSENFLRGNKEYILPGRDITYQLDNVRGSEIFYFVASYTPMKDIQWILELIRKEGTSAASVGLLDETIKTRGSKIKGSQITGKSSISFPSTANPKKISAAAEKLTGKGYIVRVLSFEHR